MTSTREVTITAAVRRAFPKAKNTDVVSAIHAAAQSDVALAQIDKHLAAHPDALTSGHSSAPPPVIRLVKALQGIGLDAKSPKCGNCGRAVRLPYKKGEERWCGSCYLRENKATCLKCGKNRPVGTRTHEGPLCQNCLRYTRAETCLGCGRTRPVTSRTPQGPRCQSCTPRKLVTCSACGTKRPVQAMIDGKPVCTKCYKQPKRVCGVCGESGVITITATTTSPDTCSQCYSAPLKPCPDCGIRQPCSHDVEYLTRPGNENLGPLDAETLARRRRMAPRPLRQCARCLRPRPAQAAWPMGPVCSTCYDAVLKHPGDCAACGKRAALIGRSGDEGICGPCAGSDRTYACRGCGQAARTVADGQCARCYAQSEFDRILADASDHWAPLRRIPQDTESPLALVAWLRNSRGAALLEELIATGETPTHAALRPGKAEHYLRSLLVQADVLEERVEPLERLTEWVETLVEDDPAEMQQMLRRFAQWHVLRRARRRINSREFTESSGKWARQQVSVARHFLIWLSQHDATPEQTTQALIDLWLASGNTRRYLIRDFISWLRKDRIISRTIKVPLRTVKTPTTAISEADRWSTLRRLLTDSGVPDEIRVAGILVLVYGQHLSRVVSLLPSAVTIDEDICRVTVAGVPLPLPADLAQPLARMSSQHNRGKSAVARKTAGRTWLFPGGNPGHHITSEHLRTRLAEHGITLRSARQAALLQWAQDTPGPILAASLGLHINTATAWRDAIQADYGEFVATRVSTMRDVEARGRL